MSQTPHTKRASRECGLAVTCDRSGRILSVFENRSCASMDLAPGVSLSELVDAASLEKVKAFLEQAYLLGSAFDWELNVEGPDGIRVASAAGVRDGDSLIVILASSRDDAAKMLEQFISVNNELVNTIRVLQKQLSAAGTDATEQPAGFGDLMRLNNDLVNLQREMAKKNAELAESRRLIQSIVDTTPDAIYLFDLVEQRNTFVNRGFDRILGYPAEEMRVHADHVHEELLHAEDRPAREDHLVAMSGVADGEALEWEYRLRSADGEWRWLRSRETVFERDGTGRPTKILGSALDITEQRFAKERLVEMAIIDAVTGLYNRRGLETLSRQPISRAGREGETVGMLFADLDGLKGINDTLGHAVGDEAIKEAARILSEISRASDVVARVGGDEFVVLTSPTDESGMEAFRSRVYAEVARFNEDGSRPYQLEMSIGFALCGSSSVCTLGEILEEADGHMYVEKRRRTDRRDG